MKDLVDLMGDIDMNWYRNKKILNEFVHIRSELGDNPYDTVPMKAVVVPRKKKSA